MINLRYERDRKTSSYVVSEGTTANNVVNQWSALHGHRLRVIGVEQSLADANFVRIYRPPEQVEYLESDGHNISC